MLHAHSYRLDHLIFPTTAIVTASALFNVMYGPNDIVPDVIRFESTHLIFFHTYNPLFIKIL